MISFIIPTRNNLPYLKLAYNSIRKFYPTEEIVILDDNSTDGTKDWLWGLEGDKVTYGDQHLQVHYNEGKQVGHTVLYDIGVIMASNEIFTIFHADMVCGPNYVENLLVHLKPGTVVSATRIEPPLHPAGKEKIVENFGIHDHDFKFAQFEFYCTAQQANPLHHRVTTKGIFAPWAMYKKDFQSIGGHDKLFSPFPYEDSDLFQRFILNGFDIIQSRDAFVYHFTCRGHRWTEQIQKDDLFYKLCCAKNLSHFMRKWGSWIQNDEYSYPIIQKKYDIGFVVSNCNEKALQQLEPLCSTIYVDMDFQWYINQVQPSTPFDLKRRVMSRGVPMNNGVLVYFDASRVGQEQLQFLYDLPKIIADSGESGEMIHDIFRLHLRNLTSHEKELINNNSDYYINQLLPEDYKDPYYTDSLFRTFEEVKKRS